MNQKKELKSMINKLCIVFLLVFSASSVFSQQDQITIIGKGQREIEPAYRLLESPRILDSLTVSKVPEYPMLYFQVPTRISLDTIERASVESSPERIKQLFPFYLKAGIGTALMPMGDLYIHSTRSYNLNYGLKANHLSAFRTAIQKNNFAYLNADFDNTETSIFVKLIEDQYKLMGSFDYLNNGFNYYGARKGMDTLNINPTDSVNKQRFQNLGGKMMFEWVNGDSAALNFKLDARYNYFFSRALPLDSVNKWNNREHFTNVNLHSWYKHEHEVFYADLGVNYNGYRQGLSNLIGTPFDSSFRTNNTVVYLKPGVRTQMFNDRLKVEIGTQLAFDIYEKTRIFLYPKVEIKYSMFNDIFIPYIGIDGDLKQNTFRGFSALNPFLNVYQDSLRNNNNLFSFHGGIKGVLSNEIGFNLKADYSRHIGYGLFVSDSSRRNTFGIVYDTLNIMQIEGSMTYTLKNKLNVEGIARYNSYQTTNNAYAWNLPQLEFILRGKYNLYDKLYAQLDGELLFGRKALLLDSTGSDGFEDGQYFVSLKPLIDLNLEAEYRYNSRVSVFLQLNNLVSVRYNRYYNYPVQGFQLMGGITCRF